MASSAVLPFGHPADIASTLGLSPQLSSINDGSFSLPFTSPGPSSPPHALYKSLDDTEDASDTLDADAFSLYAAASQRPSPLSPTSQSSLSPPHSLSSVSSVSSLSSASPPPCSVCSTCCARARRLSLLVPTLKQKIVHTASLVSLYQSTRSQLQERERRLVQSEAEREEVRRAHAECGGRERRLREESDRREVRLRAQESHIQQLKASYSKVLAEKDEREGRERSLRELQRDHDGLVRRCEKLREAAAALQQRMEQREEEQRTRAVGQTEAIDWLVDTDDVAPIIIDAPPPQPPSSASLSPSAVQGDAVASAGTAELDVSRTMAIAEQAINALKAQLKKKTAVIAALRAEQKTRRARQVRAKADGTDASQAKARESPKRRKGSAGQIVHGMPIELLDDFAVSVEDLLMAGEGEEPRTAERPASEKPCKDEQKEAPGSRDVIRVVREELVMATAVDDAAGQLTQPVEVVRKKRGRPRIHPIKEKKAGAPRGRPRKNPRPPTEAPPPLLPPLPRIPLPTRIEPVVSDLLPVPSVADKPTETAGEVDSVVQSKVAPRDVPHHCLVSIVQQIDAVLTALATPSLASPTGPVSSSSTVGEPQVEVTTDAVCRITSLVRLCPCSSPATPTTSSSSLAPVAFPRPTAPLLPAVANCEWCSASSLSEESGRSHELLQWGDLADHLVTRFSESGDDSPPRLSHRVCVDLLDALDAELTTRWQPHAGPTASPATSSCFLQLFCHRACEALFDAVSSAPTPSLSALEAVVLAVAKRNQDTPVVRALLLQSLFSSRPSLPFLERVAALHPAAFAVSPSTPVIPMHHIKAVRLITASLLLAHSQASTDGESALSSSAVHFPALMSLLSSETSSLSSASQQFVFSRLVDELLAHATMTPFVSQERFTAATSSLLAAFHLLFHFFSFPIAYSVVRSSVLPALARCKSALNAAIVVLVLPTVIQCAVQQLDTLPPPSKADASSVRQAVVALVQWCVEVVQGAAEPLAKGATVEVLLRATRANTKTKVPLMTRETKNAVAAAVREWTSAMRESDVKHFEPSSTQQLSGWVLLPAAVALVQAHC